MTINSCKKGKRGELRAAHFLRDLGFTAERTAQHCGKNGDSDVICAELPNVFIESKAGYDCDLASKEVRDWCEKADLQAGTKEWAIFWFPPRRSARLICYVTTPPAIACITNPEEIRDALNYLNELSAWRDAETKEG